MARSLSFRNELLNAGFEENFLDSVKNYKAAKQLIQKPQRRAFWIGVNASLTIRLLKQQPRWLRPTQVQRILRCSSFTLKKYRNMGFFLVQDFKRRPSKRSRLRYRNESVQDFVEACSLSKHLFQNGRPKESSVIFFKARKKLSKIRWAGVAHNLTVSDVADILDCSSSSVIRLIKKRMILAERKTPCRWRIKKSEIFRLKGKKVLDPHFCPFL